MGIALNSVDVVSPMRKPWQPEPQSLQFVATNYTHKSSQTIIASVI